MPLESLNAQRVEAAHAPVGGRLEIRDKKVTGLELRVTSKGAKTWYFQYTRHSDGKRRRVLLGSYPALSLKDARRRAIALRGEVENRQDPAWDRRSIRKAITFRELAELRLETDNAISASTKMQYRQAFDADVFGAIGHIPAREVTADAIARVLDVVESRGASVHADRVRSAIGSTFKWAVKRRQAGVLTDPTAGLGKRSPGLPRTRLIADTELICLWQGIDAAGSPLTKRMQLIVKLAMLTGQRRAEVCGATISELDLNNSLPAWTIPGDKRRAGNIVPGRMKNRLDRIVPVSRQAAELWREAVSISGQSDCVFPSHSAQSKFGHSSKFPHIRPDSVSQAMRRLTTTIGLDDAHLHDMRRCIATWCGNEGVRPGVIDLILSHKPRDVTRQHYNFAGMYCLVREAMQAWADHVWEITYQSL